MKRLILGIVVISAITAATHGLALFDGKVLDDFWHQKGLREHGWSGPELMRSLVIAPADFLHTWWQTQPVVWHYFRPFFILCMKVVFVVMGGGNPMALHAFSVVLHFVSGLLVWRLCLRLTGNEAWSLIGGLLFVIYPHSVVTVAWPSSQNVVLATTLMLGAVMCYARASGLAWSGLWRDRSVPSVELGDVRAARSMCTSAKPMAEIGFWLLWLLAVFTRENAILLPAFCVLMDVCLDGMRHAVSRWVRYAMMFMVSAGFYAWREWMRIPPLPDVYCRRPDGDLVEYAGWLAAKFLHYVCASIWIAPMTIGPTGHYNPWREAPGDCALMIGIVVALGLVYWRASRASRAMLLWPAWVVMSVLPVTAVVATPHSGYMSGVGWATGIALAAATAQRCASRVTGRVAVGTALLLAIGAAFMTPVNRLQWMGIYSAERYLPEWVMTSPPPRETRDVFFLNLPFVNIYVKPNLVDRLGTWFEEVRVHVLAWAPWPLGMEGRTYVVQEDERSFSLSVEGRPYFSGFLGRFTLGAFGGRGRFAVGEEYDSGEFRVRIVEADEEGVWKLRYTFNKPLTDSSYCFYLTSPACGAMRLRFEDYLESKRRISQISIVPRDEIELARVCDLLRAGHADGAAVLFSMENEPWADAARRTLREVCEPIATAMGSTVQRQLRKTELTANDWQVVKDWWISRVDDQVMQEFWLRRHDFDDLIYMRFEVEFDRRIARRFVETDLYLSGRPFPGPR